MARTNGGITGKRNVASFGKCKVTTFTSSGNLCTQAATRIVESFNYSWRRWRWWRSPKVLLQAVAVLVVFRYRNKRLWFNSICYNCRRWRCCWSTPGAVGATGSNSVFNSQTACGGGGGANYGQAGVAGGSGGGGGGNGTNAGGSGVHRIKVMLEEQDQVHPKEEVVAAEELVV